MGFFNYWFNFATLCILAGFVDTSDLDRYHKIPLHLLCLLCLISNLVTLCKYENFKK